MIFNLMFLVFQNPETRSCKGIADTPQRLFCCLFNVFITMQKTN